MSQMAPQAHHRPVVAHFDTQKLVNPSTLQSFSCTIPDPCDLQGTPLGLYAGLHPLNSPSRYVHQPRPLCMVAELWRARSVRRNDAKTPGPPAAAWHHPNKLQLPRCICQSAHASWTSPHGRCAAGSLTIMRMMMDQSALSKQCDSLGLPHRASACQRTGRTSRHNTLQRRSSGGPLQGISLQTGIH